MPMGWRECEEGHQYEVLILRGVAGAIDREDGLDLCPMCNKPGKVIFVSQDGRNRGGPYGAKYPYFDLGLGEWLHSADEHRRMLKERGMDLVSADEAKKIHEDIWNRKRDADATNDRDMAEIERTYQTDDVIRPVYQQFREQQAAAHTSVAEAYEAAQEARRSGDARRAEQAFGDYLEAKSKAKEAMTAWWR